MVGPKTVVATGTSQDEGAVTAADSAGVPARSLAGVSDPLHIGAFEEIVKTQPEDLDNLVVGLGLARAAAAMMSRA